MRHRKGNAKLGRPTDQRLAIIRGTLRSVIQHEHVVTTYARAKATARVVDRCIQLAKSGSLAGRRRIFSWVQDRTLVRRLCEEVAPRFKERSGGYSRVLKTHVRQGDGASMALLTVQEATASESS